MCMGGGVRGVAIAVLVAFAAANISDCRGEAAEDAKTALLAKLKYGFRYDPMKWAKRDRSWQGAVVRTQVLGKPVAGDRELIEAQKREWQELPLELVWLLGCDVDDPAVKSAMAAMRRKDLGKHGKWAELNARVLCLAGDDPPALIRSLATRSLASHPYSGCPWSGGVITQTLWMHRELADVVPPVKLFLERIYRDTTEAGCCRKVSPWIYLNCAGNVDLPVSRGIVEKQLPMILRCQNPDGGWGGYSARVFRALAKHGFLDALRELPPLPPDWRTVRSIPAPEGDLFSLASGDGRLWTADSRKNELIALSPTDGSVLARLQLPGKPWSVKGVGCWDGDLAVAQKIPDPTPPKSDSKAKPVKKEEKRWAEWLSNKDRKLLRIDAQTGAVKKMVKSSGQYIPTQVGDEIWIGTGNWFCVHNAENPEKRREEGALVSGPVFIAGQDGNIWFWESLVGSLLFKRNREGDLLDFADIPFARSKDEEFGYLVGLRGLAWDGEHLWAFDNKTRRIYAIEKTAAGREVTERLAKRREIEAKLKPVVASLQCPGPTELAPDEQALTFKNTIRNPFRSALEIRYAWDKPGSTWSVEPAEGTVKIAPGAEAVIRTSATLDPSRPLPLPVRRSAILVDGSIAKEVEHRPVPPILRRFGSAVRVAKAPAVDGKLSEGEYGAAEPNGRFGLYKGYGAAKHGTGFVLAYDDKALYLGIVVHEPSPDGIAGEPRERDGDVWRDDEIELFIDATFDRSTYHQFALGLKHNAQFDCIGGPKHGNFGDVKWNGEWQSVTKVGEGAVVVEIAIPYQTLGVEPPEAGAKWGLNLCRNRLGKGKKDGRKEMSAWRLTYKSFHVPTHFGVVTFE